MTNPTVEEARQLKRRASLVSREFESHKFHPGEYYDRFLYKILKKYKLSLEEYYQHRPKDNPFCPRLHPYRGKRLARRNPEYAYGPTGYRPPKKWFNKMLAKVKKEYRGTKAELSKVVGGIWAKQTNKVREAIVRKYEPGTANPKKGQKKCPICNKFSDYDWRAGGWYCPKHKYFFPSDLRDNPLTGTCPLHGNPISVNPRAKRVRCNKGPHWLNIPKG